MQSFSPDLYVWPTTQKNFEAEDWHRLQDDLQKEFYMSR